jgi:hypothetical protein
MRWAGHVLSMGEMRNASAILVDDHLGYLSVDGEIILELIL